MIFVLNFFLFEEDTIIPLYLYKILFFENITRILLLMVGNRYIVLETSN